MNLIIDAGNTLTKIAVFYNGLLYHKESVDRNNLSQLSAILKKYSTIKRAIVSSVSSVTSEEIAPLLQNISVINLSVNTHLPFKINYHTPNTLGVDRIALMAAAHKKFPAKHCLVIDAGSCITYDLIDNNATYQGGIIGPGLQMRYNSLHKFTARLPQLSPKMQTNILGKSTTSAIHNGVSLAMTVEINGIIDKFSNTYKELVVILTGGDTHFLSKRLKSGIFAHSNFLMQGLNYILEYNTDK